MSATRPPPISCKTHNTTTSEETRNPTARRDLKHLAYHIAMFHDLAFMVISTLDQAAVKTLDFLYPSFDCIVNAFYGAYITPY